MNEIQNSDPEKARLLMGQLCLHYQGAIAAYFRIKCSDPGHAEDLAQAFHEHLLAKNRLEHFQRRPNSRFRHYLSVALRNFWLSHLPPSPAAAERPEGAEELPSSDTDPERTLDEGVALETHRHAVDRLSDKLKKAGKEARAQILFPFLLQEGQKEKYEQAGSVLGLTANAVRKAVHDLRQQYYDFFRMEVAKTVDPDDLGDELRHLIRFLPDAVTKELPESKPTLPSRTTTPTAPAAAVARPQPSSDCS